MFYDLAIIYRNILTVDKDGISSFIIRNEYAKSMNLTEEELFNLAYVNTKNILPIQVKEITGFMLNNQAETELMYVISNKVKINGAVNFLYIEETLAKIAEKTNSNLYILPSSIHEVIVLKAEGKETEEDVKKLIRMVKKVNSEVVDKNKILSNSVYFYNKNTKSISIFA